MVTSRKDEEAARPRRPPATTPEGRQNQLVSKAVDLAEKQIEAGTASAQVIVHYLKLATMRDRLEVEKLSRENELLRVRAETQASSGRLEELYTEAKRSMLMYGGRDEEADQDDYRD